MRGYGRDYDNRGWLDRAGETVRGWFGGGRDYDRDFGGPGDLREWQHGTGRGDWGRGMMGGGMGGGHRMNNWNNMRAGYDAVYRAGSYYGADYDNAGTWGMRDYDRDFGAGRRMPRMGGGMHGGTLNRGGYGGGMRGGQGGGMHGDWMQSEYGGGGYNSGNDWGDYNRGGWGGDLFRRSNAGGVEPGRHFRGYGHGSTSGSGYEPF